jgi:hypothetical protein
MFESKQEIAEAVDAIYAILDEMDRGDVLEHDKIRKVLRLKPHQGRWDHIVHKALRRLEKEKGIAYWALHNVGYRLLTAAETLDVVPTKRLAKQAFQAKRIRQSTERLPEKGLTQHQRRLRASTIDLARKNQSAVRAERKSLAVLLKPTSSMPRRPVIPNVEARPQQAN